MGEHLYELDSFWIALGLLACMAASIELGHWIGRRRAHRSSEAHRTQVNAIQASMLGVLALVLGFTFSLALERYDQRNEALAQEAAAISTAAMRAELLPGGMGTEALALLREYVDHRAAEGSITLAENERRREALARAQQAGARLCELAQRAVEHDQSPVRSGLFVQALNGMLDAFATRESVLERHVPEAVLWLLFLILMLTSATLGFSSGVGGHRPPGLTLMLSTLLVLVTFLVIDLDRPRRGLIQLQRDDLVALQLELQTRGAAAGPAAPEKRR